MNPFSGIVFDIQRAGLYDGPGVRTVIFLKGCPLRCQWCYNPESQRRQPQISFHPERCTLCGACVETCQHNVHSLEGGIYHYHRELCKICGSCVSECAFETLQIARREMSVAVLLAEIERDRIYYEQSGGVLP